MNELPVFIVVFITVAIFAFLAGFQLGDRTRYWRVLRLPVEDSQIIFERIAHVVDRLSGCEVKLLRPEPGESIVLESVNHLKNEQCERLHGYAKQIWPNNPIAILTDGLKISAKVYTPAGNLTINEMRGDVAGDQDQPTPIE